MRLLFVVLCLFAVGCGRPSDTLRIGVKGFTEQRIVAEILRQLLASEGGARVQIIECGDTFGCQQALRTGRVDLITEYSGTAALYLGLDPRAPLERLREAYAAEGLVWGKTYGFDNGYRLAVSPGRAEALGLTSIADLAEIADLRVACPRTYLRRPGDGLAALADRHGLRLAAEPLVIDEPLDRVSAVLSGRADVAVVYGTDGVLEGTLLLEDSLDFFPPYLAAPLARRDAATRFPSLPAIVERLAGRLDDAAIQELNRKVELLGYAPRDAARSFLAEGEMAGGEPARARRLELPVAVVEDDRMAELEGRAVVAIRRVHPERAVVLRPTDDPAEALREARSRLALVGADRFFELEDGRWRRTRDMEAVAVVGARLVHLLRRAPARDPFAGRIGIPAGSGARTASAVLAAAGVTPERSADEAALVGALLAGEIDGAVIVAPLGKAEVRRAVDGGLELVDLPPPSRDRLPFLRASRIPADAYRAGAAPVDTMSAQVLLAGPGRRSQPIGLRGGPAAAMLVEAAPLSLEEAQLLVEATGVPELPDPVLPAAWETLPPDDGAATAALIDTVLNALVLAFLAWLAFLAMAPRDRDEQAGAAGATNPRRRT